MFLVDSNIWLELLLDQEKSAEVRYFLKHTSTESLYISEFSLYSIGVILNRMKQEVLLKDFYTDILQEAPVHRLSLDAKGLIALLRNQKKYHLDFDDSYQYTLAENENLILVSFDSDFDKTPRKRKTPLQIKHES